MPRNKYPEETVQKILDVSLKLFTEKGYEETTILDIVDNLGGLTRGAFYHHFKSKEDVLHTLLDNIYDDDDPFEAIKEAQGGSGMEKIKMVFSHGTSARYPGLTRAAISLLRQPRFLAKHLANTHDTAKLFEPLIEEGMADGSIRPGNAKFLAELGMLLLNFWLVSPVFISNKAEFVDKAVFIKEILDGLGFPLLGDETMGIVDKIAETLGVPAESDTSGP
ncbi:MAG: TetR/AcrR family transcriptional regulator [Treponema sp.]|nr:TetR/AcrR family transcriptional regulator [Treponema sp.]